MPESIVRRLYPTRLMSARRARTDCEITLGEWGFDGASEFAADIRIIVGELMANVVTHGRVPGARGRRIGFVMQKCGDAVRVEVRDGRDDRMPEVRQSADLDDGGRGLALVAAVADKWGVLPEVVGKTVWAEKRIPVRV